MIFHNLIWTLCADPPLGRIDKSSLSQQTLMELLIENIDNADLICGSSDDPRDVSEWFGISLNDQKEIIQIDWSYKCIKGSIDFQWLPASVTDVCLDGSELAGSLDTRVLPESLINFSINSNTFSGEVLMECLPPILKQFDIGTNTFSGTVDLKRLPDTLVYVDLSGNPFVGSTDFSTLPSRLEHFSVSQTGLSGAIVSPYEMEDRVFWARHTDVKIRRQRDE